jgi:hypothetical protein
VNNPFLRGRAVQTPFFSRLGTHTALSYRPYSFITSIVKIINRFKEINLFLTGAIARQFPGVASDLERLVRTPDLCCFFED